MKQADSSKNEQGLSIRQSEPRFENESEYSSFVNEHNKLGFENEPSFDN